jgi:lysozyme
MPENSVIDISHSNAQVNLGVAANNGVRGVIHKATEGATWSDDTYATRNAAATAAGLLWGAYHFGTAANPVAQADFFLTTIGWTNADNTLLALDYEHNDPNPANTMSLNGAEAFIQRIKDRTGSWPIRRSDPRDLPTRIDSRQLQALARAV